MNINTNTDNKEPKIKKLLDNADEGKKSEGIKEFTFESAVQYTEEKVK
jgi:hypothetical protein